MIQFLHTFPNVILWTGDLGKILGTIQITSDLFTFTPLGFENSSLMLKIMVSEITYVKNIRIFDLANNGVVIETIDGKKNIFILEQPKLLKAEITALLSSNTDPK